MCINRKAAKKNPAGLGSLPFSYFNFLDTKTRFIDLKIVLSIRVSSGKLAALRTLSGLPVTVFGRLFSISSQIRIKMNLKIGNFFNFKALIPLLLLQLEAFADQKRGNVRS